MINNRKLKKARNKIDQIDRDIFNHIKKRTNVIKHMLSLKMYKKQIIDYNRINEILKNIKKRILEKNNYLLWGGNFFSTNISCFRVAGLYFFIFNLTLAFNPEDGFFT